MAERLFILSQGEPNDLNLAEVFYFYIHIHSVVVCSEELFLMMRKSGKLRNYMLWLRGFLFDLNALNIIGI